MILSKEQRIGASILFGIALIAWLVAAVWPYHPSNPNPQKKYRTWEERKDSMKRADSIRYAEWAAEREQRYDSFRLADSLRRAEWKRIRQQQYDSFRLADSLWRDSVGWRFAKHEKKDTVLDLNHCDTTELLFIRGIGRYTAMQIVRYRESLGGYCSPVQLTEEPFVKCHLDTLLHHFTADPSDIRTIPVNVCSIDRLQRHPYLRYHQAKAIYTLRRRFVRLHSIDDLRSLPELTASDLDRLAPYLSFE
jgi:DNA uptake protein ComE-like DNA-binding protein